MTPVQETMPGLASASPPPGPAALLDGAHREAMERAGRLLAARPRSEKELSDRLTGAGFKPAVVAAAVERLRDLGLLNDEDFALQWVEERSARKNLSSRALMHELRGKGIPAEMAASALERAGLDEEAQARDLAARYVRRVASKPLPEQFAKIKQMLTRKGFAYETADSAARAVLPPEGWD